jgi:cell division protein ZapA (FtsZ GTPase activity inhibitor)
MIDSNFISDDINEQLEYLRQAFKDLEHQSQELTKQNQSLTNKLSFFQTALNTIQTIFDNVHKVMFLKLTILIQFSNFFTTQSLMKTNENIQAIEKRTKILSEKTNKIIEASHDSLNNIKEHQVSN